MQINSSSETQKIRSDLIYKLALAASLAVLLFATLFVYWPGLTGNFLFDDFANLDALGIGGSVHDLPSLVRYLTSGGADPLGRPLTLLSFLIDAQDWPADPYSFKRTNVLLHLLNGSLLCWTMLVLGRRANLRSELVNRAAVLGSAFWLLHPLFVSTTLYIVQREAMLPATFTFCGLLFWFSGRSALDADRKTRAWCLFVAGAGVCTSLATLSKANGLLLPLLIATADYILANRSPTNFSSNAKHLRAARIVLLALPIAALLVILVLQFPTAVRNAADHRPWTVSQRLISEPRVITDYLRLLFLPRSNSFGVFNDHVKASSDLFHPWTTFPCLIFVVGLIVAGWLLRKAAPFFAFAILFYFAGQLLESTYIPLELAYEHRNYLPAAFLFWPLSIWIFAFPAQPPRQVLAIVALLILASLTWVRAQVWGNLGEQALVWGKINPNSPRAQAFAAAIEMNYGHTAEAVSRLKAAALIMPDEIQITLNLAQAECRLGEISQPTWDLVIHSLRYTTNGSSKIFDWFASSVKVAREGLCLGISFSKVEDALASARANEKLANIPGRKQDFDHIEGLIALSEHRPETALNAFNNALKDNPDRGTALSQAAALGSAGYPALGLQHMMLAETVNYPNAAPGMPRVHQWILEYQGYWKNEFSHLEKVLTQDADSSHSTELRQ